MRPAFDLNCFRQCWHLSASCSCGHGPAREKLDLGTTPPSSPRQPYLLANLHMLLEPHEGLSGDHPAGGADSLSPFMDGPLPLLLRATWGAGPGPQGLVGAPSTLDAKHRTQGPCPAPHLCATGRAPQLRPGLGPSTQQPPPGAGWATGAGTSLMTVLAGAGTFFRTSSALGPSCFLVR